MSTIRSRYAPPFILPCLQGFFFRYICKILLYTSSQYSL